MPSEVGNCNNENATERGKWWVSFTLRLLVTKIPWISPTLGFLVLSLAIAFGSLAVAEQIFSDQPRNTFVDQMREEFDSCVADRAESISTSYKYEEVEFCTSDLYSWCGDHLPLGLVNCDYDALFVAESARQESFEEVLYTFSIDSRSYAPQTRDVWIKADEIWASTKYGDCEARSYLYELADFASNSMVRCQTEAELSRFLFYFKIRASQTIGLSRSRSDQAESDDQE